MTAPEDQNGLREALARVIDPDAWRVWDAWKERPDGRLYVAAAIYRDKSLSKADDIIAGPLASLIAERDAAVQRNAEEFALRSEAPGDPWEMVRHLEEQCLIVVRERDEWKAVADRELGLLRAAEAEITRLKEGMEAAATRQSKIDFFGLALHSLGVGAPGMKPGIRDAIARNIALRIRSALSPKEHPHG